MTIRRRTYPEVLNNVLTGVSGGVAAESHPYARGQDSEIHLLRAPVGKLVSVHGRRNAASCEFRVEKDFTFDAETGVITWTKDGVRPDIDTLVEVNYYPSDTFPPLTDIHAGSVVRTLCESISLEMARIHAQLQAVYEAGYVDTAAGRSLDNVVALLGIERIRRGRPTGEIELQRAAGSVGAISIPAGTRFAKEDGAIEYETTAAAAMADGQKTIRIPIRDLEVNDPVPADAITQMPIPVAGVGSATNPAPTAIGTRDETDAELRTRAKQFLHGSERATLGALKAAILRQGVDADVDEHPASPGVITVTPHAGALDPELKQRLLTAIHETRPAGVQVNLAAPVVPWNVHLELTLITRPGLLPEEVRGLHDRIRASLTDYFDALEARSNGSINKVIGAALTEEAVEDVQLTSATWDDGGADPPAPVNVLDREAGLLLLEGNPTVLSDVKFIDSGLPASLSILVIYPDGEAPPDETAIESALSQATAYLSEQAELNAAESNRTLSFARLFHALPLPGKTSGTLSALDAGDETAPGANATPYSVTFVAASAAGKATAMADMGDPAYVLSAGERIELLELSIEEAST